MKPDIYPTDWEQERRQIEDEAREEGEGTLCPNCGYHAIVGESCSGDCTMPSTCACPDRKRAHWWPCHGCADAPVRHPADLCSECQDPDPIEEPS